MNWTTWLRARRMRKFRDALILLPADKLLSIGLVLTGTNRLEQAKWLQQNQSRLPGLGRLPFPGLSRHSA